MATVQNPFMSLSASGTVGALTAVEKRVHKIHVELAQAQLNAQARGRPLSQKQIMRFHNRIQKAGAPRYKKIPTAAQFAHRAKVKLIAAAWKALTAAEKTRWNNKDLMIYQPTRAVCNPFTGCWSRTIKVTVKHGYAVFLLEYFAQGIAPPDLPKLPA